MRNHQFLGSFVAAVLVVVPASAQEGVLTGDVARGSEVLAQARDALGGDRLTAVSALQMKGRFQRAAGSNQVEGDLELTLQLPGRMKRVEDTSAPGGGPAIISTQVLNGTDVWDENTGRAGGFGGFGGRGGGFGRGAAAPGGGRGDGGGQAPTAGPEGQGRGAIDPERLRQALLRQRQGELQRLSLGLLLSTDAPVVWIGTAEAPDGKADVLEIRPPDGTPFRLFLDVSTHMPLMVTWQGAAPQAGRGGRRGQPQGQAPGAPGGADPAGGREGQAAGRGAPPPAATLQITFADYKVTGGVRFPHTITRGVNGQTNEEWTVSSYRVNPSLKADAFSQK